MNCVKCGSYIARSDCSILTCGNDLNVKLIQCECKICTCSHRTPNLICNKCTTGDHRGKI